MHIGKIGRTIEQTIAAISQLNLDCIKFKLMDTKEGEGWTRERADNCEKEYRRFLTLLVKYPNEIIVPTQSVDKFWHAHILDTMKYAEDCQNVFGYFLHHFPYFGMRGEDDAANFQQSVENTKRLYQAEFADADGQETASSYCSATQASSYCSATQASSYCSATQASSYCSATQASSYCSATQASSYCSANISKLNTDIRPVLSPA